MELLEIVVSWNVVIILFSIFCFLYYKSIRNLPPGPWGLPVVGYAPFMIGKPPTKLLADLAKNYGNVMSVKLGSVTFIVLSELESIKEVFGKSDDFAFRPYEVYEKMGFSKNIVLSDGEESKQHRRFFLSTLREFGIGKLSLESKIIDEIKFLVNELRKYNGKPTDPREIFYLSIANIIHLFEYGARCEYFDPKFKQLLELFEAIANVSGIAGFRICFPWITKLQRYLKIGLDPIQMNTDLEEAVNKRIKEHQNQIVSGSKRDYVKSYIEERNKRILTSGTEGFFTEKMLISNILIIFYAGFETTSKSLLWGIRFLMKHPEVQQKIQAEIQNTIGNDRYPSISDRPHLPYTEATIMEIHRCASVVPLAVSHANKEEATINGFRIPKRSIIISNLWAIHNDKAVWKDPEVFRPERFIDIDGCLKKSENVVPFGIGKRSCVGENLAQMVMFLYFTTLLQNFTFKAVGEIDLSAESDFDIVVAPKRYKASFVPVTD